MEVPNNEGCVFLCVYPRPSSNTATHTIFSLTPANAFERLAQSLPTESMRPRSPCVLLAQWSPRTSQHLDVSSMALFGGQMPKTLQRLFRSSWLHSATLKQLVSQIDLGPCTCLEGSWHVLCQIHCGDLHAPLPNMDFAIKR